MFGRKGGRGEGGGRTNYYDCVIRCFSEGSIGVFVLGKEPLVVSGDQAGYL